jgi:hypothetical protein
MAVSKQSQDGTAVSSCAGGTKVFVLLTRADKILFVINTLLSDDLRK